MSALFETFAEVINKEKIDLVNEIECPSCHKKECWRVIYPPDSWRPIILYHVNCGKSYELTPGFFAHFNTFFQELLSIDNKLKDNRKHEILTWTYAYLDSQLKNKNT